MDIQVEQFSEMLMGALGLAEPWYVSKVEFEAPKMAVHIYVEIRKIVAIPCPKCGSATKRFGYEKKERIWRHGDCLFYPCYVHCKRPKVQCPHCGVSQINAPFERKNSRFTLLFEGFAMMVLPDMPILKAAKLLRCDEKSLVKIMRYWVKKAVDKSDLSKVTALAIDETSFKRGHNYVTLVIDSEKRCVIDVEQGKDKGTINIFAEKLVKKGGSCEKIKTITSDMSKAFLPAIAENFPDAENVIDKFHVKKVLMDALEKVRKEEQKSSKDKLSLFRGRRLFMIPEHKLTDEQSVKLAELSKRYPKTGRAYRIVAALDDFYACETMEEGENCFQKLYSWMRRCRLQPMKKAAETLLFHKGKILAYFNNRVTNAICEGLNSMVQAAKRKARGYRTFEGYEAMIYLLVGKLKLDIPPPF